MESKRIGKSSVKKVNWKDVLRPVAVFPFRPFLPPTIAPIVACNSQATYLILLLALLRKTIKTFSGFVD